MIEILPESQGNVLGVRATGKLTSEDYENVWMPRLEQIIKEHGKVRCLLHLAEGFEGWDLGGAWDDAKFGVKHARDFEKIAVVGGAKWVEWSTRIGGLLVSGEVKTFEQGELDEAWTWIKA